MQRELFRPTSPEIKCEKNAKKIVIKYFFGSIAEQTFSSTYKINEKQKNPTAKKRTPAQKLILTKFCVYIFSFITIFYA